MSCNLKRRVISVWPYLRLAVKSALSPTIALGLVQIPIIAEYFGNYGYVVAAGAMLAPPVLPNAKFFKLFILDCLFTCIAALIALLAVITCVAVRHDDGTARETTGLLTSYDANACWIAIIWMITQIVVLGLLRGPDPLIDYPCSCWMIVTNFGISYAPLLADLSIGLRIVKNITVSLLFGYGLSALVAVTVFPESCRSDLISAIERYVSSMRNFLEIYTQNGAMENSDVNEREKWENAASKFTSQLERLDSRIQPATWEIGVGRITGTQLKELSKRLKGIYYPINGIALFSKLERAPAASLMGSFALKAGVVDQTATRVQRSGRELIAAILGSIDYVVEILELLPCLQKNLSHEQDIEEGAELDPVKRLVNTISENATLCSEFIRKKHSISAPSTENTSNATPDPIVYVCSFLRIAAERTLRLVHYAQYLKQTGTLKHRKLIFPCIDYEFYISRSTTKPYRLNAISPKYNFINTWPNRISCLVGSYRFGFALRMACATFIAALPVFIQSSQRWYIGYHALWMQYAAGLAMKPSSGKSFQSFILRVVGTVVATALSLAVWYISRGNTIAAVILFFFLQILPLYLQMRFMEYWTLGTVSAFTIIFVLGYQLQVDRLGVGYAASGGAVILPAYSLAMLRAAVILAGICLGFIWTIFPYPLTEVSLFMDQLAGLLDHLAEYYGIACETSALEGAQDFKRAKIARTKLDKKCTKSIRIMHARLKVMKYDRFVGSAVASVSDLSRLLGHATKMVEYIQLLALAIDESGASCSSTLERSKREVALTLTLLSDATSKGHNLPFGVATGGGEVLEQGSCYAATAFTKNSEHTSDPEGMRLISMSLMGVHQTLNKLSACMKEMILGERC